MRPPRLPSLFLAASVVLASAEALAAPTGPHSVPIQVPTVLSQGADDAADALTKALRSAVRQAEGWSLAESDYSLELLALDMKCNDPPDAECAGKIADHIKTDRLLWSTVKVKKGQAKAEIHLWVRGVGDNVQKVEYTANLSGEDETLVGIAKTALKELTGGPPRGTVKVKAPGINGQVFADGAPLGALKNGEGTFGVPAGTRKITVRAPEYNDAETSVEVKPGATAEVSLTLTKKNESKLDWQLIGGIASLGVGAVGLGVGLGGFGLTAAANGDADFKAAKSHPQVLAKGGSDVCQIISDGSFQTQTAPFKGAVAACQNGSTGEIMQAVGFPLAGVFGGLGVALLATRGGGSKQPPKAGFVPIVGPGFVGGSASLKF